MTSFSDIVATQKTVEESVKHMMMEFETKLKASSRTDSVDQLYLEFSTFRSHVQNVLQLLQQQITELSNQVDNIEMRHRKKILLLNGVAEKPGENIPLTVLDILQKHLGMELTSSAISKAYRLGSPTNGKIRPIVLRLSSYEQRADVWRTKTKLKGTSFVLSEYLTKQRKSLFLKARSHFNIRNVCSIGGTIMVKLPNGSRYKIESNLELENLILKHPKLAESETASQQQLPSSKDNSRSRSRRPVKK